MVENYPPDVEPDSNQLQSKFNYASWIVLTCFEQFPHLLTDLFNLYAIL